MAHDTMAIADLVADALDVAHDEISDVINAAPLLQRLPFTVSTNGTTHKYSKYTGEPAAAWRAENAGIEIQSSQDTVVSETLKILDASWWVDQAVANAWRQGGWQALMAREMPRHLGALLFEFEKQLIQGTNNDAAGFNGFEDSTALDGLADTMVIDAGGTTASTGSSVYLIVAGTTSGVSPVVLPDTPISVGEITEQSKEISSKSLNVYNQALWTWGALQIGGAYSVARIANLTGDSGKGMTDDLFYEALSQFPAGHPMPNICVGSRRSMRQWRESRTATNATGMAAPSVAGTSIEGVEIVAVESISDTETLLV